jgi:hypothetical protein
MAKPNKKQKAERRANRDSRAAAKGQRKNDKQKANLPQTASPEQRVRE